MKITIKIVLVTFLTLLCISSCNNNHCDDPMYTPFVVSFYSELDTTVQISPRFLIVEGVDAPYYMDVSGKNSMELFLKKFDESSSFAFSFANDYSAIDTLIFVAKISNFDSPCVNSEDSVLVYRKNDNIFFLCNHTNSLLILYNEQPEISFFRNVSEDTLFVFKPTRDILSVKHTNTQEFISAECGCLTTFYINEIRHTNNNITDVSITKRTVTSNYNEKHVKIFFENY